MSDLPKEFDYISHEVTAVKSEALRRGGVIAEQAVRFALSSLDIVKPGLGTALQAVLFDAPAALASQRIEKFVQILSARIEEIEGDGSDLKERIRHLEQTDHADDINFLFQHVARCPYDQHRQYYVEAFLKLLNEKENSTSLERNFVSILNTLNPAQCTIIRKYISCHYYLQEKIRRKEKGHLAEITWENEADIQQRFGMSSDNAMATLDDLISKGLMIDSSGDRKQLQPTTLAVKFMEFVLPENEIERIKTYVKEKVAANSGGWRDSW